MPSKDQQRNALHQREWYARNKVKAVLRIRIKNKKNRAIVRENMLHYLDLHPCVDCGEKDPVVLDFDHVRGVKRCPVSTLVGRGCSWKVVLSEIEKCEVRCANCHRKVTHRRRTEKKLWSVSQLAEEPISKIGS